MLTGRGMNVQIPITRFDPGAITAIMEHGRPVANGKIDTIIKPCMHQPWAVAR
jgi:hypothetical protein